MVVLPFSLLAGKVVCLELSELGQAMHIFFYIFIIFVYQMVVIQCPRMSPVAAFTNMD